MDLETAADAALLKVKQLSERHDAGDGALAELHELLTQTDERLKPQWSELETATDGLLSRIEEVRRRVVDEADEAGQALDELMEAVPAVHSVAETAFSDGSRHVAELHAALQAAAPRLASLAEGVEQTAHRVRDQAAATSEQLTEVLAEARRFLAEEVAGDLRGMQDRLRERAESVQRTIAEQYSEALRDKYENWLENLNEVERVVEDAFDRARAHAAAVVEFSLGECGARQTEGVDGLADQMALFEGAAGALTEAVDGIAAETSEAGETVAGALTDTDDRAEHMTGALQAMKDVLASYTFVRV